MVVLNDEEVLLDPFTLPATTSTLYRMMTEKTWQAAVNADGDVRDGAGVVDFSDALRFHGHLDG